jgi:urocanate hydratase
MFRDLGREYLGGALGGKLVTGCGMDVTGGARALAASMNGAAFLGIDDDADKIKQRVKACYCDVMVNDLDEALRILKNAVRKGTAASAGLVGKPSQVIPEMATRGVVPDVLYVDSGAGSSDPGFTEAVSLLKSYGTVRVSAGLPNNANARIALCVAISGSAADIRRTDRLLLELFSVDESVKRWIEAVQGRLRHQGLPARIVRLSDDECGKFGIAINELVARGELKGPIALGVDAENGELEDTVIADGTTETSARIVRTFAKR